jgi:ribonuclease P protein component
VLPPANRLRRSADFAETLRLGERTRRGHLVVALNRGPTVAEPAAVPRVGLIVGKAVGGSVVRHRLSRRLRAHLAARLDVLPPGSATVVRALAGAETDSFRRLGADIDAALNRLCPEARR